jgi:cytochrome c peroxidase
MVNMRVLAVIALMSVTVLAIGALPADVSTAMQMVRGIPVAPPLSAAARVGEKMFFDKALSASASLRQLP